MAEQAADIWLRQAIAKLKQAGNATPALDARLLLQHIAGLSQTDILVGRAKPLDDALLAKLDGALKRRLRHESVHRILGAREFYGLELTLNADTLEPRPDTETLVELVLPRIQEAVANNQREACSAFLDLLDLGTGSGAIALALLANVPKLRAIGSDISAGALQTAQQNADKLGLSSRFTTVQSDWFANIHGSFDFIVSNPPYIPHADIAELDADVRLYDPIRALDGGETGLDFYQSLASKAQVYLKPAGFVAVEIGIHQARDVEALFTSHGFVLSQKLQDLAGIDRALLFSIAP